MKTCNRCSQIPSNYNYNFCPSCGQRLTIAEDIDNKIDNLESQYDSDSYRQEELHIGKKNFILSLIPLL